MLPQPRFPRLSRNLPLRIALSLVVALLAALLFMEIHAPLPWMLGPLFATALSTMLGLPSLSWTPLRNLGQMLIGCSLGLYFTPQMLTLIASLWWLIILAILWALFLGNSQALFLEWLHTGKLPGMDRATAYFASPIGGASDMTILAERYGARADLVAAAHSLRLIVVLVLVPALIQFSGMHGMDASVPGPKVVHLAWLPVLLALTGLGCGIMLWLKIGNPWFLGALIVGGVLTASEHSLSAMPNELSNGAQLVVAVSLGVRFTPEFVRSAPRWMISVALATAAMVALSGCFAFGLGWLIGHIGSLAPIHPATLMLGTSPGGVSEMAITAKVLQLGAAIVTALHVTRLAAVLTLSEPIYRWWFSRRKG